MRRRHRLRGLVQFAFITGQVRQRKSVLFAELLEGVITTLVAPYPEVRFFCAPAERALPLGVGIECMLVMSFMRVPIYVFSSRLNGLSIARYSQLSRELPSVLNLKCVSISAARY
jgi:hypothetical protein